MAEQEVLGGDDGARGEESREGSDYVAKEVDHRAILGLRRSGRSSCARGPHRPARSEFLRRTAHVRLRIRLVGAAPRLRPGGRLRNCGHVLPTLVAHAAGAVAQIAY